MQAGLSVAEHLMDGSTPPRAWKPFCRIGGETSLPRRSGFLRRGVIATLIVVLLLGHDMLMATPVHADHIHGGPIAAASAEPHHALAAHPDQCGVGHQMAAEPSAKHHRSITPAVAAATSLLPARHGSVLRSICSDRESSRKRRARLQVYRL